MPVISLMTDFGIKDGTVGVMKGVIWGICPAAQISDPIRVTKDPSASKDVRQKLRRTVSTQLG